ncbi:GntR family transcriptional regulator [Pseudonocardia sp. KRD-182]|uniref:GntR family transcriptional regulator n=1 Tax=Pseudonocardia oceani TaxID=2792013 RepID=UPI001C49F3FF|nr:GntR family transcriptional regulator [Pseudonocardia oceani]MBW0107468.1 GntR family transcriptional regulator [Pseudonocardia oceani]
MANPDGAANPDGLGDSLTQIAYYKIRSSILEGRLPIGKPVNVVGLASDLSMSRSPVRSAIERLVSERLVSRTASGMAVTSPSRYDLLDAIEVRTPLEGLAARLAAAHVDDHALDQLREMHTRFASAIEHEDLATARRTDLIFHQTIQNLSGNPCLIDSLERVQTQVILAAYSTAWTTSKRPAALEHARILDALTQQDGEAAERAAIRHQTNLTSRITAEWKRRDTAH